jgi:hypothetical protein
MFGGGDGPNYFNDLYVLDIGEWSFFVLIGARDSAGTD